jgi:uncharacterized membrane protein YkgB
LLGFWNKQLGIIGAIGSYFSFIATFTILPFFPNGWEPCAGGFPEMTEYVTLLMRDLLLLAASFYLCGGMRSKRYLHANYTGAGKKKRWGM